MADAPIVEAAPVAEVTWHSNLPTELSTSPSITKFPNTKEGFGQLAKGYTELERVMSNEKIPVPKGPDDKVAIDLFRKAFKIPEKAEGYGLPDVEMPESMKGLGFDKASFAATVHKHNLTTEQAKGVYADYTQMMQGVFQKATEDHKAKLVEVSNKIRQEYGKDYDQNVNLAQKAINWLADSPEDNDLYTATMLKDARFIRGLVKLGKQFAENKIGDFHYDTGGPTGEEAQKEIDRIRQDKTHPYNNDKALPADRERAINHVNGLLKIVQRAKQG